MTHATPFIKAVDIDTRQEQFEMIKRKLAALIEIFLENVKNQNRVTQETLCVQMTELESYIHTLCRHFPVHSGNDNNDSRDLEKEIEWIDIKAGVILEALEKGRRNLRDF